MDEEIMADGVLRNVVKLLEVKEEENEDVKDPADRTHGWDVVKDQTVAIQSQGTARAKRIAKEVPLEKCLEC